MYQLEFVNAVQSIDALSGRWKSRALDPGLALGLRVSEDGNGEGLFVFTLDAISDR